MTSKTRPSGLQLAFNTLLIITILIGVFFRFYRREWNDGTDLHPDEYGLTSTITQLRFPKTAQEWFNTRLSPISPYPRYDATGVQNGNGPDHGMRWGQWPILIIRGIAELTNTTDYCALRLTGRSISAVLDVLTLLVISLIGRKLYGPGVGLLAAALSALAVLQIQGAHFMTVDSFATFFSSLAMQAAVQISIKSFFQPTPTPNPGAVSQSTSSARASQAPVPPTHPAYSANSIAPCSLALTSCDPTSGAPNSPPNTSSTLIHPVPTRPTRPTRPNSIMATRINRSVFGYTLAFGLAFGMTLASKINLLPLFGLLPLAYVISASRPSSTWSSMKRAVMPAIGLTLLALLVAFLTFRVTQPMSFRAAQGDTSFLSFTPNPDWLGNMRAAAAESGGTTTAPPAEQWTDRPAILFPLMNMVFWGMGLPLGLAAWAGFFLALWRSFKQPGAWHLHLLPLVWAGGFFLFMATRWVKSIRYFLPVYPFFALFAAFILLEVLKPSIQVKPKPGVRISLRYLPALLVLLGSLAYASSFVQAVYTRENTRVTATRWIYENLSAPLELQLETETGSVKIPFALPNATVLEQTLDFPFTVPQNGVLTGFHAPHIAGENGQTLTVSLHSGDDLLASVPIVLPASLDPRGEPVSAALPPVLLNQGQALTLRLSLASGPPLTINRNLILVEEWDEGLPFRLDGKDPYGMYYQGLIMPNRWGDRPEKLAVYQDYINQADLVVISSQRAIWSINRLPRMYPLTIAYYRALFDGSLGFDLALHQQRPFQIGPLQVSDLAGKLAFGKQPSLPLFNFNPLAAEEAFSVYDHAPVWLFTKGAGYSAAQVQRVLSAVDLSQIDIQIPSKTKVIPFE